MSRLRSIQSLEAGMADRPFQQIIDGFSRLTFPDQSKDRIQRLEVLLHHGFSVFRADIDRSPSQVTLLQHLLGNQGLVFEHVGQWEAEADQRRPTVKLDWK